MSNDKKVMVVGMDALIFPLVKAWIDEGVLPNFVKLLDDYAD